MLVTNRVGTNRSYDTDFGQSPLAIVINIRVQIMLGTATPANY